MTPYTKKCKATRNILGILSWLLCFGAAAFFIIFAFASGMIGAGGSLVTKMGTVLYGFMLSILPLVTIAVIVKNKVKPLVFTADVIVANVIFGTVGLYTMFMVWLLDTYVITPLYNKYKEKYAINKEIDKRG